MHIIINKKFLTFNNHKAKCALGKRGIGFKRKEGDLITPVGEFKIKSILYRKDRIKIILINQSKETLINEIYYLDVDEYFLRLIPYAKIFFNSENKDKNKPEGNLNLYDTRFYINNNFEKSKRIITDYNDHSKFAITLYSIGIILLILHLI